MIRANVAGTVTLPLIVTTHVPVPLQPPPDQPVNVEPDAGVAVSVTCCPSLNDAEHVAPQLIPDGWLLTLPEPPPAFVTASVCCVTGWTVTGAVWPDATTVNVPLVAVALLSYVPGVVVAVTP